MSTRGAIAYRTPGGWQGVYVHSDAYPEGIGKALWTAYHDEFYGNVGQMIQALIKDHPSGWSSLIYRDCYCHRPDPDGPMPVTSADESGLLWWLYILADGSDKLVIEKRLGSGWRGWASVDLRGPEPDWNALERQDA